MREIKVPVDSRKQLKTLEDVVVNRDSDSEMIARKLKGDTGPGY
jgi:hypothetical protein